MSEAEAVSRLDRIGDEVETAFRDENRILSFDRYVELFREDHDAPGGRIDGSSDRPVGGQRGRLPRPGRDHDAV